MEKHFSIKEIIEQELKADDLKLPFPESMVSTLNKILSNEDLSVEDLTAMLKKDASLTVKILNLANSAFYSGLSKIKTLNHAIARIGLMSIKSFLTASLMKEYLSKNAGFNDFFMTNWRHSLGCAICSKRIAEQAKIRSLCEDAYLVGLIHDIGTAFILNLLNRLKRNQKTEQDMPEGLVKEIIDAFHPMAGAKILEKLNFDNKYCNIVATHHNPALFEEQEDHLFNILQIADNIMHKTGISIYPENNISIIGISSTAKLGIEPLFIATMEVDLEEEITNMDNLL